MKTIALANQKGGVGKTTTAASLGVGLAQQGKKVLLVDADAQGNLTQMLGWRQPDELSPTLADLMTKTVNEEPIAPGEGILHHASGVDLVPANIELSGLEVTLVNIMSRETVLRQYLSTLASAYDYAIIDCMPSLGMLTINALTAADSVIIPVQGQYLAAKGLEQLKLYFVVDVDIKGFFDNVNHTKLIQQIWHMGIRDKKLLCIIREMLKVPIVMPDGTVEHPVKGTPQGGILSPLLSNIVLNELDWWIASQWENMPTKYEYSCEVRPNGTINKTAIYGAFKNTTKLKEVHIVRYADDFKLFCRKRSDAEKVFIAVKLWLQDRLKLEISEEKSKIVNLKRHYSEFLGFEMKAVRKRKRYVVKSHMTEKAISKEKAALIKQVKQIAHVQDRDDEAREITLYNSMVFGIHNYYRYATMIATDCEQIHRTVSTVMKNRLYGRLTKKGQINEVYIRKNYGDSKQIRFISSKTVAPVGYIQTKTPLFKKKKVCKYTPEGRAEIHKNLGINTSIMLALMCIKEPRRSVEYMDNRIALYAAQYGRCAVTGKELWLDEIHCHHKQPLCRGGTDKYMNLAIVHRDIHRLIHATDPNTIAEYLNRFQLDKKALAKLNALRILAGQPEI